MRSWMATADQLLEALPRGLEPLISALTGRRALLAALRKQKAPGGRSWHRELCRSEGVHAYQTGRPYGCALRVARVLAPTLNEQRRTEQQGGEEQRPHQPHEARGRQRVRLRVVVPAPQHRRTLRRTGSLRVDLHAVLAHVGAERWEGCDLGPEVGVPAATLDVALGTEISASHRRNRITGDAVVRSGHQRVSCTVSTIFQITVARTRRIIAPPRLIT